MAKEFGADEAINTENTSAEERIERVKEMTGGRKADVVIEASGAPEVIPEGIAMLKKGGTYLDPGTFVDREIALNPWRDFVLKSIRYVGICNVPVTGFGVSLQLLTQHKDIFPFDKAVTHRFRIDEAKEAIETSLGPDCMKVAISP
jgi:L-iditol 2-dehydrogenase